MVRRLIRNQLPRKGLRVRVPCPPLFFLKVSHRGDPLQQAMRAGASRDAQRATTWYDHTRG